MNILLNKGAIIERCIRRIRQEHQACPNLDDFTHLDALILNLERACQAAIDMAMHEVARRHLGMPQGAAQAFELLAQAGTLDRELASSLRGMVGFRNIAVHEYQQLDIAILQSILNTGLDQLVSFCFCLGVRIVS
ncbi:MAG: DUF86 domain-containing protein [Deltaproteobacteria bacterium]|nr:DUF86 domain-containing protein [Deltaproteobacteria bacterium]